MPSTGEIYRLLPAGQATAWQAQGGGAMEGHHQWGRGVELAARDAKVAQEAAGASAGAWTYLDLVQCALMAGLCSNSLSN